MSQQDLAATFFQELQDRICAGLAAADAGRAGFPQHRREPGVLQHQPGQGGFQIGLGVDDVAHACR